MLGDIVTFIVDSIGALGYGGIFLLMFIESSFFPFPSEVVMIPAGYLAFKGEMNLFMVIFMGLLGSIGGALFNYYFAIYIGRAFLIKYGKYFLVKEEMIVKSEEFFKNHGHISTFTGRLIPGVRQLISLPAGVARMNLKTFIFYTGLGAGIWVTILALLGYFIGQNEDLIKEYLRLIIVATLVVLALLVWFYIRRYKKSKNAGV